MRKLVFIVLAVLLTLNVFAANDVEIFSWWTGGGEEEGLLALIDLFNLEYPDVNVINATVAGGAGSNAKAVLKTRMLGGNPPDSFQVHAGMELTDTFVIPGKMEPLTALLKEWGVLDKFPADILNICTYEGEVYSIPVNVHRGNVVFYNKEIAKLVGMTTEPKTWAEFIPYMQKAKEAGYIGLALGDKNRWPALHLFEDIVLGAYSPEKYNMLWSGEVSFNAPEMKKAFNDLLVLDQYFNTDHSALTWQDASELVFNGNALANVMGDWAEGYFKTMGWTPGVEFGWFAVPDTFGSFMIVSDTFGLPKGAKNRENAIKWLKFLASVPAQDTFNPIKGSIPARLDADKSKYDVYLQWSMSDFGSNVLCPSIAHGSAAPEGFANDLSDIVNRFITTHNVQEALDSVVEAADDAGYLTE